MTLAAMATCLLLLMTARLYKSGSITIAMVALVQLYVIKMITATEALASMVKMYENVMGSAYQTVKTMMVPATVLDSVLPVALPKSNLEVAFNDVTYHYSEAAKGATAVQSFDLTIKPGEKIGLVGYSGSGKTTLTKLLLRFMDTTDGSITIGGIDVRDASQHDLRSHIAYVPQEPLLFHRSIAENIAYGRPSASKKQIEAAAQTAYVDEFVRDLPGGYQTLVGERGVKLSGGQRQRVAIARALLRDAPILVLDEATSALDSRSEKLIQQALWHLMKDRTALVVAHRLSTIQRMDRIVVMDKGRIVQIGSHDELLKQKRGIYAELWAHQSGGYVGVPAPQPEE
jgi:ATP-binding cassette, subfamily B, bacterial